MQISLAFSYFDLTFLKFWYNTSAAATWLLSCSSIVAHIQH